MTAIVRATRADRAERKRQRRSPRKIPTWMPIEPGPTRDARSAQAASWFLAIFGVALVGFWIGGCAKDVIRWEQLRSRGRSATAIVVATETVDRGDGPDAYYVSALVDECGCEFRVPIGTLHGHSVGTTLPIRYDPRDHSNVMPLVDRPVSALPLALVAIALVTGAAVVGAGLELRRRRRCRSLLRDPETARRVTFEAWQCGDGGKCYLVLFDAFTPEANEPLCCVPVSRATVRRLSPNDVLLLHGAAETGAPAALVCEGRVIVPAGPLKSGRWEQDARRQ